MGYFIGVDPGLAGGVAFVGFDGGLLAVNPMPVIRTTKAASPRPTISPQNLCRLLLSCTEAHGMPGGLYMESPTVRPHPEFKLNRATGVKTKVLVQMGTVSAMTVGIGAGLFHMFAACYQIPFEEVPSATWKRDLSLPKEKDDARAMAMRLWPEYSSLFGMKTKDGCAEAALIGLWGLRHGKLRQT